MKLTKEQKAAAIEKLSTTWGCITLMCDGYRVDLQVQRAQGLSYRVMTYINGMFSGAWTDAEKPTPEQKYLRKVTRPLYRAKDKALAEKVFGKRAIATDPRYSKTMTWWMPDWASGKAAINHLCKVSESIQIIEGGI